MPSFAAVGTRPESYLVYTCKAWGNTRSSGKRSSPDRTGKHLLVQPFLCAFLCFEIFALAVGHGGERAVVVLEYASADFFVVACVDCCVHLVFSVVVVLADVVTIPTHGEHVKY